jgi:hypothetical protein
MIPETAHRQFYRGSDIYAWRLPDGQWYWRVIRDDADANGGLAPNLTDALADAKRGARSAALVEWLELWHWDPDTNRNVYQGSPEQWLDYMGTSMPTESH